MNIIWKVGCWASVIVLAIIAVNLLRLQFTGPDKVAGAQVQPIAMKETLGTGRSVYRPDNFPGFYGVDEKGRNSGLSENPQ
ncbi:hypothetical protein Bind_2244 [Beijerinckia indica subsp. indica ATCC 9039]|uniref:Uncharacterized protein n=2 Tax=Beijerinckia TaxID=532 RepID=B2IH76_BEII9|nr:hypothetical protein Bind_2244 [Beijerinckia indica subsp. indica ATCC 9039]